MKDEPSSPVSELESTYLVYVTADTREEAMSLGRRAVESRLAACCNVLSEMESVYEWEGNLEQQREVAFLLKTRAAKLAELTAFLRSSHSYDCPCVVAWPIESGNDDFLNWIRNQSR